MRRQRVVAVIVALALGLPALFGIATGVGLLVTPSVDDMPKRVDAILLSLRQFEIGLVALSRQRRDSDRLVRPRRRHGGSERIARAARIVFGHPQREVDDGRRQKWSHVQHVDDVFDRRVQTASAKATAVRRSVSRRRKDPAYV